MTLFEYFSYLFQQDSLGAWRTVFLCAAGVYVVDSLIFLIFGSSKSQPWNEPTLTKEKQKKQKRRGWKIKLC